jgi:hypothetical protein
MSEVGSAVEWIDDPAVFILSAFDVGRFFGEDRMIGKFALDDLDNGSLADAVYRGDQIDGAFVVDGFRLIPTGANNFAGASAASDATPRKPTVSCSIRTFCFAIQPRLCYLMAREDSSAGKN